VQYKILKEAGGIEKEGAFIPFRDAHSTMKCNLL